MWFGSTRRRLEPAPTASRRGAPVRIIKEHQRLVWLLNFEDPLAATHQIDALNHLRGETRSVLDKVQALSGKGVEFLADPDLPVLATMHTARDGASFHTVRFNPNREPLDYFLVYQAGFLIRLFRCPADQRYDFIPAADANLRMGRLIEESTRGQPAEQASRTKVASMIAHWALMTLRSLPVGMRVDQWIAEEYPSLSGLQHSGIAVQQQQNVDALSLSFGDVPVPPILLGMYAAYAMFTDRMLGVRRYALPYHAAGLGSTGESLLKVWDTVSAEPTADRNLVDSWASLLGLAGWYEWQPYRP